MKLIDRYTSPNPGRRRPPIASRALTVRSASSRRCPYGDDGLHRPIFEERVEGVPDVRDGVRDEVVSDQEVTAALHEVDREVTRGVVLLGVGIGYGEDDEAQGASTTEMVASGRAVQSASFGLDRALLLLDQRDRAESNVRIQAAPVLLEILHHVPHRQESHRRA